MGVGGGGVKWDTFVSGSKAITVLCNFIQYSACNFEYISVGNNDL